MLIPIHIFQFNSLPQVIYMHILPSLNRALYLSYICRIMCDSKLAEGLGLCFEPQGDPATFKDELSAPRETLINAG